MLRILVGAALALSAVPAIAGEAGSVRAGAFVFDANNVRVGTVDRVLGDGSLRVIFGKRFVTLPAATVSMADKGAKTSLTRKEVNLLP